MELTETPKILITEMPRIYSTVSADRLSSASWYIFMNCLPPIMLAIIALPTIVSIRMHKPTRQLMQKLNAIMKNGIRIARVASGIMCATIV
ncbi:Uncharacterised protein [Chlamydia trachomatis]|nr:Uncharacterised protein [Chlamydia trachomatis]